jgi:hypothetical protein
MRVPLAVYRNVGRIRPERERERVKTIALEAVDVVDLIRRDMRGEMRHHWKRLVASLVIAVALIGVQPFAAAIAGGMVIAWTYSLVERLYCIWRWYANLPGSDNGRYAFEFREEGIYTEMTVGQGVVRWDSLRVKQYPRCLVFENDGEELLILPRRRLTQDELAIIEQNTKTSISRGADETN